jgi:polyribonucleotide nucleotidyltransferase
MHLLSLVDNKVEILPEAKLIKEFSTLSPKELAYVYFMEDYQSPYNVYSTEDRHNKIKEDIEIKGVSEKVTTAQKKYSELQETTSMRLLKSARLGITKLTEFFEKRGPSDRTYVKNLESLGKLIESIDRIENKVKKELSVEGRAKAGRKINHFEQ